MAIRSNLFSTVALIALTGTIARAQTNPTPSPIASVATAAAQPLTFDAVSIRRNLAEMGPATARFDFPADGDGLVMADIVLRSIVWSFYGDYEQSGMPAWANSECYDIRAKVAAPDLATYHALSSTQRNRMVQTMLEDRFKLRVHVEQRDGPIYALVVANQKIGAKLKESPSGEVFTNGPKGSDGQYAGGTIFVSRDGEETGHAASMSMLAGSLKGLAGRQIVDRTGLTGVYDFTFTWEQRANESGGPSLFTALEEQLGLKLEPSHGPVTVLVIDHIERPTEN